MALETIARIGENTVMQTSLDYLSIPKRAQLSQVVEVLCDPVKAICDDRIVQLAEAADAA